MYYASHPSVCLRSMNAERMYVAFRYESRRPEPSATRPFQRRKKTRDPGAVREQAEEGKAPKAETKAPLYPREYRGTLTVFTEVLNRHTSPKQRWVAVVILQIARNTACWKRHRRLQLLLTQHKQFKLSSCSRSCGSREQGF